MLDAWLAGHAGRRRRYGRLLIGYGVSGLLILIVVAGGLGYAAVRVGDLATRIDTQRDTIVRLLGSVTDALETTSDSATRLGTTLTASEGAVGEGAGLARLLAESSRSIVALGDVEIFGQRPFSGLGASFATVADQADQLATSLDRASGALGSNVTDVIALGDRLEEVGLELRGIRRTLDQIDLDGAWAVQLALVVLLALLLWLALPALFAIRMGRRLTRSDLDAFD